MTFKTFKNLLLDLIFPRYCLGCKIETPSKQASLICEACFEKIVQNRSMNCRICDARNDETCRKCRPKTNIKGLYHTGFYQDPILREMIHRFKYSSIESLKKPLAKLMISYIDRSRLTDKLKNCVLVPIPLTLKRKMNRGFNQSELLALEIAGYLNLPMVNLLKRKSFSASQAEISDWQKRKENVSGVFSLSPSYPLFTRCRTPGKIKVVLVDDVSTSGATLEEAAAVLKKAGVKEVYGLVVAKG